MADEMPGTVGPVRDLCPVAGLGSDRFCLAATNRHLPYLATGIEVSRIVAGADEAHRRTVGPPCDPPIAELGPGQARRLRVSGGIHEIDPRLPIHDPAHVVEPIAGPVDAPGPCLALVIVEVRQLRSPLQPDDGEAPTIR